MSLAPFLLNGDLYIPKRWESPGIIGDDFVILDQSDPEYDEWMMELQPIGPVTAAVWREELHPRDEEGQFAPKSGAAQLARWESLMNSQLEAKAEMESRWKQDEMGNDYDSDYWRFWADENLESGGQSTLPLFWAQGHTMEPDDVAVVDGIIRESRGIREDTAVWRGSYGQSSEPSSRPISTSFSKYSALAYADRTGGNKEDHLHRVIIPAGTRVGWHGGEDEVVLPTGTSLEVVGPNTWIARVPPEFLDENMVGAAWDESKHPRDPGGEGGGQFVESGTVVEEDAPVMGLGSKTRRERIEQNNDSQPFGFDRFQKAEIEAGLKEFLDDADLSMRVPESALEEILNDGEFYNQHQSGTARGLERSTEGEANLLGLPADSPAEALPKYAYFGPDNSQVNMYGPFKIVFKDNVKDRTTFTVGDSLMTNAIPSPARKPWWGSAQDSVEVDVIPSGSDWFEMVREETGSIAYMEAQIYGKLTPDDIHHVEVLDTDYWDDEDPQSGMPLVDDQETMANVVQEFDRLGIQWYHYTPEGDFSGEWA